MLFIDYKQKYLKYKAKYLELIGGAKAVAPQSKLELWIEKNLIQYIEGMTFDQLNENIKKIKEFNDPTNEIKLDESEKKLYCCGQYYLEVISITEDLKKFTKDPPTITITYINNTTRVVTSTLSAKEGLFKKIYVYPLAIELRLVNYGTEKKPAIRKRFTLLNIR